MPWLKDQF
jgi:hypothetical protein